MPSRRKKVLFFAEDFSLAHVGRALHLAQALDPERYEVAIACGGRYAHFVRQAAVRHLHAFSVDSGVMIRCLAEGKPLYTAERLAQYVDDDLRLLEREAPDLVVSDFRVSLGISAPLMGVPLANLVNAHWSPASQLRPPMPEHPVVRRLGVAVSTFGFGLARPFVFRHHASAFRELRKAYALPAVGDLRQMYTAGTWTMYADVPTLSPCATLPAGHFYLGPITWEPPVSLPSWWHELPEERPVIYCSIGSSGSKAMITPIVAALAGKDVSVMISTAGVGLDEQLPDNFFVAPYLPGDACVRRAALVICNGGAGSVYQALRRGKRLIGVPSNLDQYLVMRGVTRAKAGLQIRAGKLSARRVEKCVAQLLENDGPSMAKAALQSEIARYDAGKRFAEMAHAWLFGAHVVERQQADLAVGVPARYRASCPSPHRPPSASCTTETALPG